MAKAKKQTSRGRKQDLARVAGGEDHEVSYEAKKTRKSNAAVTKAVKKVGNSRKRVENKSVAKSRCNWNVFPIDGLKRVPSPTVPKPPPKLAPALPPEPGPFVVTIRPAAIGNGPGSHCSDGPGAARHNGREVLPMRASR